MVRVARRARPTRRQVRHVSRTPRCGDMRSSRPRQTRVRPGSPARDPRTGQGSGCARSRSAVQVPADAQRCISRRDHVRAPHWSAGRRPAAAAVAAGHAARLGGPVRGRGPRARPPPRVGRRAAHRLAPPRQPGRPRRPGRRRAGVGVLRRLDRDPRQAPRLPDRADVDKRPDGTAGRLPGGPGDGTGRVVRVRGLGTAPHRMGHADLPHARGRGTGCSAARSCARPTRSSRTSIPSTGS